MDESLRSPSPGSFDPSTGLRTGTAFGLLRTGPHIEGGELQAMSLTHKKSRHSTPLGTRCFCLQSPASCAIIEQQFAREAAGEDAVRTV